MKADEIKKDAARRIVDELCKHSIYQKESAKAEIVRDALGRCLSQRKLNHVFEMVVLGRR